jgi:hypothetical protein
LGYFRRFFSVSFIFSFWDCFGRFFALTARPRFFVSFPLVLGGFGRFFGQNSIFPYCLGCLTAGVRAKFVFLFSFWGAGSPKL